MMIIEIKDEEINVIKWLIVKGMEITKSNYKYEIFDKLLNLLDSHQVQAAVKPANGGLHEITTRVYKHELVDLISDLTFNNENFDPDEWSRFDGERLKKASDIILSHLSV